LAHAFPHEYVASIGQEDVCVVGLGANMDIDSP
jgi:hypothetical protein